MQNQDEVALRALHFELLIKIPNVSGGAVSQSMSAENIIEIDCYWKSAKIKMTHALSITWLAEDVVVSVAAGVVVSGRAVVESGFVVFPGSGSGSGVIVLGSAVVVSFVLADEVFELVELAFAASVTAASCSISSAAGVSSDTSGASVADIVLVDPTVEDVVAVFGVVVALLLVAGVVEAVVETFVVSIADTDAGVIGVDEVAETVISSSISVSTVVATGSSMSSGTVKRSIRGL